MTAPAFTIGGSEAASCMSLDPFRSAVMLWAEKTGRYVREPTEAMRWGTLLEPVIVSALREDGIEVALGAGEYRDDERDWLIGHPDAFANDGDGDAVLEIKTTSPWGVREWAEATEAPIHNVIQLQHYLHLTGLDRGLLAVLVGGQRLEIRHVERDNALIEAMIEAEEAMMWHLTNDSPPAPDGSASAGEALKALHPEAEAGKVIRLTGDAYEAATDLRVVRESITHLEKREKELIQTVQAAMGDAETAISPGDAELATWKAGTRTALDTARLKAEAPHIFKAYSKTTATRTFRVA